MAQVGNVAAPTKLLYHVLHGLVNGVLQDSGRKSVSLLISLSISNLAKPKKCIKITESNDDSTDITCPHGHYSQSLKTLYLFITMT